MGKWHKYQLTRWNCVYVVGINCAQTRTFIGNILIMISIGRTTVNWTDTWPNGTTAVIIEDVLLFLYIRDEFVEFPCPKFGSLSVSAIHFDGHFYLYDLSPFTWRNSEWEWNVCESESKWWWMLKHEQKWTKTKINVILCVCVCCSTMLLLRSRFTSPPSQAQYSFGFWSINHNVPY